MKVGGWNCSERMDTCEINDGLRDWREGRDRRDWRETREKRIRTSRVSRSSRESRGLAFIMQHLDYEYHDDQAY
jgi:hypothetical protein